MAAAFNFIGAFAGTAVAKTIGAGLVDDATTTQAVVMAALLGAITWNLITWRLGIPSSSSHALIGGLLGATVIAAGWGALNVHGIVNKVLIPLVTSPLIGFFGALPADRRALLDLPEERPAPAGQPLPAAPGRLGRVHGLRPRLQRRPEDDGHHHPRPRLGRRSSPAATTSRSRGWVIVISATAISLGTAVGGWRIMKTMGHRVVELEPITGFAAETTAATVIYTAGPFRHAGLHDARHLQRDHGRRLEPRAPAACAGGWPAAS